MEKEIKDTNLNITPEMFKRIPKDDIEAEKIAGDRGYNFQSFQ